MRNLLLAACVLTSLVASAGPKSDSRFLTWVGDDTGVFEDSANWRDTAGNAATPAHYDTLVFPKGGTFTKGSSYLTLWGITVTSPDPVTIRTGSLTFEGVAAGVRLRGASLALPDGVGGMRVETVGVFSASNCPYIRGEGELCLQTGTMILVK